MDVMDVQNAGVITRYANRMEFTAERYTSNTVIIFCYRLSITSGVDNFHLQTFDRSFHRLKQWKIVVYNTCFLTFYFKNI